jgi:hypothetical protein
VERDQYWRAADSLAADSLEVVEQRRLEGTAPVPKTTTQTSQLGLAADIDDRIGLPKAASTAPADGGSSEWRDFGKSKLIDAMLSEAPDPSPKRANIGRGETPSGMT